MITEQPLPLAPDCVGRWVWTAGVDRERGIPRGVLLSHADDCSCVVSWTGPGAFTLASLVPLSVEEDVVCGRCGVRATLADGRWVVT